MEELKALRNNIDQLDDELIELLVKRFNLSLMVKEVKEINKIQVLDSKRETEIISKISAVDVEADILDAILEVYQTILKTSKQLQSK